MIQREQISTNTTFAQQLKMHWRQEKFVCVGLDPSYEKLPAHLREHNTLEEAIFVFNREIIDATHDLVCAYKPNSAFYEAYGERGYRALMRTVHYIKEEYPSLPVILDAKRADIDSTNLGYVQAAFDVIGVDAP